MAFKVYLESPSGSVAGLRKKILSHRHNASALALFTALTTISLPVHADMAPVGDEAMAMETIVVTGSRIKEDVQKASTAIAVLSDEQLETKSILQISDLQYTTPSLSITDTGLSQNVNIRGIGLSSTNANVSPGVPIYLDGLLQPPIVATTRFYDLQSIEVYRGPQGTFAGANSTGGAMFVLSNNPSPEKFSGSIAAWGGDYWDVGVDGAVNLPLTDTMAFRVGFNFESRDSFYKLITPAPTLTGVSYGTPGTLAEMSVRLGYLWEPVSRFSILVKLSGTRKDTGGYTARPLPGTANSVYAPANLRELAYDTPEMNKDRVGRAMLELKYAFPSGLTLRSITGYQDNLVRNIRDLDATANAGVRSGQYQDVAERPFSEEINLISPQDEAARWILGGFYWYDKIKVGHDVFTASPVHTYRDIRSDKLSAAMFGRVLYDLSEALQIEAGGRFTHDEVTGGGVMKIGLPGATPVAIIPLTGHWQGDSWTTKIGISYNSNAQNFLYAFVAKGVKMGGVNAGVPFKPETVWDYEIGWKASLLDSRLVLQLSGFYSNYKNFQYDAIAVATGALGPVNIPSARIDGTELQVYGYFGPLKFDTAAAWIDTELGAFRLIDSNALPGGGASNLGPQCAAGAASNPPLCFDYSSYYVSASGRRNPYAPSWTANFGVEYSIPLATDYTLTPRLDYVFQGNQWSSILQNPVVDFMPSHDLWNLRLTLDHGQWSLAAYVTNLMDRTYLSGRFSAIGYYGPPRQYGLRLSHHF